MISIITIQKEFGQEAQYKWGKSVGKASGNELWLGQRRKIQHYSRPAEARRRPGRAELRPHVAKQMSHWRLQVRLPRPQQAGLCYMMTSLSVGSPGDLLEAFFLYSLPPKEFITSSCLTGLFTLCLEGARQQCKRDRRVRI
jgi:hypothetical protein